METFCLYFVLFIRIIVKHLIHVCSLTLQSRGSRAGWVTRGWTRSPGQWNTASQTSVISTRLASLLKAEARGRPRTRLVRMEPATQDTTTLIRERRGDFLPNSWP